jgi:Fe-S-cluster containining protein
VSLPEVDREARDVSPVTFRCTSCGNCCRALCVAVTSFDVARLVTSTGMAAAQLVRWLGPDDVDMTGEPQSFVELSEGRRLMALAQRDGACRLLGADNRCSAYAARPRDCRTFPFDFAGAVNAEQVTSAPPRHSLALLPPSSCEYASDGNNDVALLEAEDHARWSELQRYQQLVAHWNHGAWHRRRLLKSVGGSSRFLDFALERARSENDGK